MAKIVNGKKPINIKAKNNHNSNKFKKNNHRKPNNKNNGKAALQSKIAANKAGSQRQITLDLDGKKFDLVGLSRNNRKALIDSIAAGMGGDKAIMMRQMGNMATTLATAASTLEAMGNESEAQKLRLINRTIDSFIDDMAKLTPEQLKAITPILNKTIYKEGINKNTSLDGNLGTVII